MDLMGIAWKSGSLPGANVTCRYICEGLSKTLDAFRQNSRLHVI